jgi:hypothetical protein
VSTVRKNYWRFVQCSALRLPRSEPAELSHHKNVIRTSHPMTKLMQRAVIRFFTLTGFRPQQIQTEFSDVYHGQTFQLRALEKWHKHFADRRRDLKMNRGRGDPRKLTLWAQLLHEKPVGSGKAICRRRMIPRQHVSECYTRNWSCQSSIYACFYTISTRTRWQNGSPYHTNQCMSCDWMRIKISGIFFPEMNLGSF